MAEESTKTICAKDVMSRKVISVSPDATVFDAAKIISEHNFDGIPVTDPDGKLLGIVTEYDLITRTSPINTPPLKSILNEVFKKMEEGQDAESPKEVSSMKVSDIMNKEPMVLKEDSGFDEIVYAFIAHHKVNPIPIVDEGNKVVGIISRSDVLRPLNLLGYGNRKNG